jgi:hypothetical protein
MRKTLNPKYEIRNPEPEIRIREFRASNFEFRVSRFAFGLFLLAGFVFAQYDEVWESDVYSPRDVYTIGIAQAMPDSLGMQLVFIDGEYRTDQYQFIRMVNASTGDDIWESDSYYYIHTEAPNQPRLVDIDNDGLAELIMLVEYDPGYAVWTMYKYDGRTGKPRAAKPVRPLHKRLTKTAAGPAAHPQN